MSKSSKMGRPRGWTNGDGKYSEFKKRNGMECLTKVIKKKTKYNSKKPDIEHRKHLANERISNALFTHPEIPKRRILLLDDVYQGNANTSSVLKKKSSTFSWEFHYSQQRRRTLPKVEKY